MKIITVFILCFLGGIFISLHGQVYDPLGNIRYTDSLIAQSRTYLKNGEYEKSLKYEQQIIWRYEQNIKRQILHKSEEQLNTYFENNTLDDRLNAMYSLLWHYPVDRSIKTSYEYTLFSKLLLLNSIKVIRSKDLLSSNNNSLVDSYLIPKFLGKSEVAIEFFHFRLLDKQMTDSIMYGAFLLRKDDVHPVFIPLFEENSLKTILLKDSINGAKQDSDYISNIYEQNGKRLYQLIWQPLEKYLSPNDTVYYSLSGLLNKISFSALPTDSGYLLDKYNLHLVSHSHEIIDMKFEAMFQQLQFYLDMMYALKLYPERVDARKEMLPGDAAAFWEETKGKFVAFMKESDPNFDMDSVIKPLHSAIEYGGIIYDAADDRKLIKSAKQSLPTQINLFPQNRATRSNLDYLEESAKEVNAIEDILNQYQISNAKFKGLQATEKSFKNLSGISPELLHIATHGFFLEDEKDIDNNKFMQLINNDNQVYKNPLLRSGLLFAGANRAWTNDDVLPGIEDGILTSEEISHLDLSKTKLVVLSACDTGLGEVQNSEGVFGLQRAFKLAGAETLVMSLWKVDDKTSSQFMLAFYRNLLAGKGKLESFRIAQKQIREQQKNPYYWAAFVMMD